MMSKCPKGLVGQLKRSSASRISFNSPKNQWLPNPASPACVKFETPCFSYQISPRSTSLTTSNTYITSQRRSPDWLQVYLVESVSCVQVATGISHLRDHVVVYVVLWPNSGLTPRPDKDWSNNSPPAQMFFSGEGNIRGLGPSVYFLCKLYHEQTI
jgi:hypothetical protein